MSKRMKTTFVALLALAGAASASRALAADYVLYKDATIGQYGSLLQTPGGAYAYFGTYADNWTNNWTLSSDSPDGGNMWDAQFGPNSYGGLFITFQTSGGVDTTVDFSTYAGGDLKFYAKNSVALDVTLKWVDGSNNVQESSAYAIAAGNGTSWTSVDVPLTSASFGSSVDYSKLRAVLVKLHTGATATSTDYYVDYIRLSEPAATTPVLRPGSTRVNPGEHRMFLVDDTVLNPTLSLSPSNLGSLSTTTGNLVVFTANSTIQSGTINATKNSLTGTANIQVTSANIDQQYALAAAETISTGVTLGSDANLLPYADSLGSTITVTNVTNDLREGTFSLQSNVNISDVNGYAGWAIEWSGTSTDMNEFYDGSIRFWFKGDSTLSGKVKMSIRSTNVSAGSEQNVWLQNYVTFDNTWRPVVIPVSQLAGAAPQADLSRIKVLFNIALSSPTAGSKSFFIDKLRWDTRTPGALNTVVVTPGTTTIPKSLKKTFIARGYDSNNVSVDIWPTWSVATVGTLNRTQGDSVQLTASNTTGTGGVTATQVVSGSATVTVANIVFTQSFNVYSDAGAGGQIGTDSSGGASFMNLSNPEYQPGNAPEGLKVMNATYTVSGTNAYATWFVYEVTDSRYLSYYSNGYLHFWVRSNRDLEISIRSNNVSASSNKAKFRLSDLGVPLDGNWQEVWLSLNDFALLDSNLDFSQMKVYFAIAAIQSEIGNQTNQVFDVDDVKWYTDDPHVPDPSKVYIGLKNKQSATTGLVVTFDNDSTNRAVTYDQALASMAYTYETDTALAKKVLDVYKSKYTAAGGSFAGFNNEYDRDDPTIIRDYDRLAGPNAWIMLAAIHYRCATSSTTYDTMINGIGTWLKGLQDTDGAIKYGFVGNPGTAMSNKSTEQNFDVYAAFKAWYSITGDNSYNTAANNIYGWLTTASTSGGAWNVSQSRFNVGELSDGSANTDYALDAFSWASLALNGYESVLDQAESLFVSTHNADVNGLAVTGFDFSGTPGNGTTIPYGLVPDKDAVWLEGTGHMVVAYLEAGRQDKATQYLNELNKAVYTIANGGQGLTYATNAGTAYWTGSLMDSTHAAISPMAWYLFANWGFNPLQPLPLWDVTIKNISNNAVASNIDWGAVNVPSRWNRATQYVQVRTQAIDTRAWGMQIYTDNTSASQTPRYRDPYGNISGDPSGLIENLTGEPTTHYKLPAAWRVVDSTSPTPAGAQPYDSVNGSQTPDSPSWFYIQDRLTPGFADGADYITIESNQGAHTDQNHYFKTFTPDYIYFEADFGTAAAFTNYKTTFTLEYFFE